MSCIVIPKIKPGTSSIVEEVGNLGFKVTSPKINGANYHFDVEVEADRWKEVLDKVFDMSFFDKYSFHLEKDADDAPPVPVISTLPKPRKRLLKSSEVFVPPPTDAPADQPADQTADQPTDQPKEQPANPAPEQQPEETPKPAEPNKDGKRKRLLG